MSKELFSGTLASLRSLVGQFLKFGIVGVAAFAIDFGIMVLLKEMLGIAPVLAATVSFGVSVVFNYVVSMRYVFARRDDMSRARELVVFVALSVVGLGINDVLMLAGTEALSWDYRLVKIAATAIVMVWNFVSRKVFLERHEARSTDVTEADV